MRLRGRPRPLWFDCLVAVALACALRALDHAYGPLDAGPGDGRHVEIAFWGFLVAIASAIWSAFTTVADVTVQALVWLYGVLSAAVVGLVNGLAAAGHALLKGLDRVWRFFGRVYDDVLKPAWKHFWGWFDKFTKWLDRTFAPIIKKLLKWRTALTDWWKTWVQPWLDLIDITRTVARGLGALGVEWGRALDARLGAIEAAIQRPFQYVLRHLNEVIDVVNRIATIDGLVQRVALVRSLARDYEYAWRALVNPYRKAVDPGTKAAIDAKLAARTAAQIATAYGAWLATGTGDRAAMYAAIEAAVTKEFAAR